MKVFAQLLKQQSPTAQLQSYGHGWLELPNGQRWQPATSKVSFLSGCRHPMVKIKRRPWWFRLMGLRG
ncbi:phage filamentation protein Fil family protein [Rahnella aceris]|uniref:phage filamentation protein Fil family protein n=1 Tax=Rahnella sp. (strain Y9602) TaxID=2703885 RepID=UPI003FD36948